MYSRKFLFPQQICLSSPGAMSVTIVIFSTPSPHPSTPMRDALMPVQILLRVEITWARFDLHLLLFCFL